jgi:hypothetical protein
LTAWGGHGEHDTPGVVLRARLIFDTRKRADRGSPTKRRRLHPMPSGRVDWVLFAIGVLVAAGIIAASFSVT